MFFDPIVVKANIVKWIREYFRKNGDTCSAVIGISGGKDSSIVAALCVEALGKERVFGVLMPCGEQHDIDDSYALVNALGIDYCAVNIGVTVNSLKLALALSEKFSVSEQAQTNLPPRIRMATLYAVAQSLPNGGRVANTCNYSEDYIGYATKFGDTAGDFAPIAELTVQEVREIGYLLPIPRELVDKTPSDGLCGKSDEDNFGFTYKQLEDYLNEGSSGDEEVDKKIIKLHTDNAHKYSKMPTFNLSL